MDARSLNAWRLNLERRSAVEREPTTLRLVELVGEGRPATTQASGVRLVVDALVIEVDRGFDAGTLYRVLDLLAQC